MSFRVWMLRKIDQHNTNIAQPLLTIHNNRIRFIVFFLHILYISLHFQMFCFLFALYVGLLHIFIWLHVVRLPCMKRKGVKVRLTKNSLYVNFINIYFSLTISRSSICSPQIHTGISLQSCFFKFN